jgi:hypothetical protein
MLNLRGWTEVYRTPPNDEGEVLVTYRIVVRWTEAELLTMVGRRTLPW